MEKRWRLERQGKVDQGQSKRCAGLEFATFSLSISIAGQLMVSGHFEFGRGDSNKIGGGGAYR